MNGRYGSSCVVRHVPRRVTVGFTPSGAGYDPHRTLLVTVGRRAPVGTFHPVVVGTGGGHEHRVRVTLKIRR